MLWIHVVKITQTRYVLLHLDEEQADVSIQGNALA